MKSSQLNTRRNINTALNKSVLLLDIIENRDVFGSERDLRLRKAEQGGGGGSEVGD